MRYLHDRSVREEDTAIIKNKGKFLRAPTTSGHRKAIEEMLASPDLLRQLSNVKAADEVRACWCVNAMSTKKAVNMSA